MSDPTKILLDGSYYRSVSLWNDPKFSIGGDIGSVVILERIVDQMMDFAKEGIMQFMLSPVVKNDEIVGFLISNLPAVAKND